MADSTVQDLPVVGTDTAIVTRDGITVHQITLDDMISPQNAKISALEINVANLADSSLPSGGTAGQVLAKVDDTAYNIEWIDPPTSTYSLDDLTDVDLTTPPIDGQVLVYDDTSSTWIPGDQTDGGLPSFSTITVPGVGSVVADQPSDTLTLIAGSNITISVDPETDSITINSTGGGGSSVLRPSITSPSSDQVGFSNIGPFESSVFESSLPDETHQSSSWQIAADDQFTNIVNESIDDGINLTSYTLPELTLMKNTVYYIIVKHTGSAGVASDYSPVVAFTTAFVSVPTITFPTNNATKVEPAATFTAGPFEMNGTGTHTYSDWLFSLLSDFSVIAHESLGDTVNLEAYQPPLDSLDYETSYYVRVRYYSVEGGLAEYSQSVFFTTKTALYELVMGANAQVYTYRKDGNTFIENSNTSVTPEAGTINGFEYSSDGEYLAIARDGSVANNISGLSVLKRVNGEMVRLAPPTKYSCYDLY